MLRGLRRLLPLPWAKTTRPTVSGRTLKLPSRPICPIRTSSDGDIAHFLVSTRTQPCFARPSRCDMISLVDRRDCVVPTMRSRRLMLDQKEIVCSAIFESACRLHRRAVDGAGGQWPVSQERFRRSTANRSGGCLDTPRPAASDSSSSARNRFGRTLPQEVSIANGRIESRPPDQHQTCESYPKGSISRLQSSSSRPPSFLVGRVRVHHLNTWRTSSRRQRPAAA